MNIFKKYSYIMISTFKQKSMNRILQEIFAKEIEIYGSVAEFGSYNSSSKSFINFLKKNKISDISFYDKFPKDEKTIKEDLEKKLDIKNNSFDNIIIFNVLEHVYNVKNSLLELNRCLKKNSKIIGAVPFIYRVHGAPNDYIRFTKDYLEKILIETNFKNIRVTNIGFGPFTASYTLIFDYLKIIPFLSNLILILSLIIDKVLGFFVKTNTKNIYPLTVCFIAEKK